MKSVTFFSLLVIIILAACSAPAAPTAAVPTATLTSTPADTPIPPTPIIITATFVPTDTPTLEPTMTTTPSLTPTVTPIESTAAVAIAVDEFMVEMAFIPAGPFTMGNDQEDNAKPAHSVFLDEYSIDVYEVTNESYLACVTAGVCAPPAEKFSNTHPNYYGNPEFARYPVLMVDWDAAQKYCSWRKGRLPTEAEWEKAARADQMVRYPWGRSITCDKANYSGCVNDTTEVGAYPDGASPYGIYDLGGNLMEWINDWYNAGYYASSPERNPTGPETGIKRVIRGGGWNSQPEELRVYHRTGLSPDVKYLYLGFRCVRPAGAP